MVLLPYTLTFISTPPKTMRLLALLLLAVTTHSSPMSVWPRVAKDKWETVTCSDPKITDAKALANERWQAADVATSWTAALTSWQQYEPGNGQTHLKFPAFISDFYGGPEGWDCQNPVNTPCSTTVKCADTTHPAGYAVACPSTLCAKKRVRLTHCAASYCSTLSLHFTM